MKKLIILLVAFLMLVFCNATVSQAVTLSFDPGFQGVLLGNQIDVDVVISGLGVGEAPSLGGFELDIGYDPTIIEFTGYVLGSYLGDISLGEAYDNSLGESSGFINIYEFSWLLGNASDEDLDDLWGPPYLDDIQLSSFTLATLTFDTRALGTSSLDISFFYDLSDAYGDPLMADLQSGSINVVPVPEPATLFLLGTGLAGIGFLRKKRMNRVSL